MSVFEPEVDRVTSRQIGETESGAVSVVVYDDGDVVVTKGARGVCETVQAPSVAGHAMERAAETLDLSRLYTARLQSVVTGALIEAES